MTQTREIIKVKIIPWEESKDEWGILIRYEHGSSVAERVGSRAQAEAERGKLQPVFK
jgi:hypothetical protein